MLRFLAKYYGKSKNKKNYLTQGWLMTWGWLGLAVGSCNATTHNFKGGNGKEAYIEACGLWTEVHSSLSETVWGPKKLATIGKRLLVILLKRHCLTNLDTGRKGVVMIKQSYKCIWSTCSALCENFLGFIHCILCFAITLTVVWTAHEMFKVPSIPSWTSGSHVM